MEPSFIKNIQSKIDLEFTKIPGDWNPYRFPRSFAATSMVLDSMLDREIDMKAQNKSYIIGESVFFADYAFFDGIREMLETYKQNGKKLFLWTKGDKIIQERKIKKNNAEILFEGIYIVGKKTPVELNFILSTHQLNKEETIVIGDSCRDEIKAANDSGIDTVWVSESPHAAWGYEDTSILATFEIKQTIELPTVIPI